MLPAITYSDCEPLIASFHVYMSMSWALCLTLSIICFLVALTSYGVICNRREFQHPLIIPFLSANSGGDGDGNDLNGTGESLYQSPDKVLSYSIQYDDSSDPNVPATDSVVLNLQE